MYMLAVFPDLNQNFIRCTCSSNCFRDVRDQEQSTPTMFNLLKR